MTMYHDVPLHARGAVLTSHVLSKDNRRGVGSHGNGHGVVNGGEQVHLDRVVVRRDGQRGGCASGACRDALLCLSKGGTRQALPGG